MLTNITLLKTMLWVEVTDICRSYDIRYLPGEKVRYIIRHEVKVIITYFPKNIHLSPSFGNTYTIQSFLIINL